MAEQTRNHIAKVRVNQRDNGDDAHDIAQHSAAGFKHENRGEETHDLDFGGHDVVLHVHDVVVIIHQNIAEGDDGRNHQRDVDAEKELALGAFGLACAKRLIDEDEQQADEDMACVELAAGEGEHGELADVDDHGQQREEDGQILANLARFALVAHSVHSFERSRSRPLNGTGAMFCLFDSEN